MLNQTTISDEKIAKKTELLNLATTYFKFFEEKNLESMSNMLDNDIILTDPIIKEVRGKQAVLEINKALFKGKEKINIQRSHTYVDEEKQTVVAEIIVSIGELHLKVTDIITFNLDDKIVRIQAYFDSKEVE